MDQALWTFKPDSFLPHERVGAEAEAEAEPGCPVLIGAAEDTPDDERALLINLADTMPAFVDRFTRIAEIVNQDEGVRTAGRKRYTRYRDCGHELHHHRLD